jgi:1,4-alpha-glucan branching enzyme
MIRKPAANVVKQRFLFDPQHHDNSVELGSAVASTAAFGVSPKASSANWVTLPTEGRYPSPSLIVSGALLLLALAAQAQSTRPGWGSTPYNDSLGRGVTFRVWAPNATSVYVPGTFNNWDTSANPLGQEISNNIWNGVWSADVTSAAAGDQYKYFVNYPGGSNYITTSAGSVWRHDPRTREVVSADSSPGDNDIIYDPTAFDWAGDAPVSPALNDLVVYELHIGTFCDPRLAESLPGRYIDAINSLDYVKSLGVNAVEIMPIAEFPGYSNWGYAPADPFAADNYAYGGPDGFKTLVAACHARGLAVFLDVVHNHYGPTDLDLWDFDGWTGGGSYGGGIYFYQQAGLCCTTYGSRPNFSSQPVRDYIQDNFTMWLGECHVDGFRWDTPGLMMNYDADGVSGFINDAATLITNINLMIHTNAGKTSIAEDVMGAGFDSTWDTIFPYTITPQLALSVDSERDMSVIAYAITNNTKFNVTAGFNRVAFLESHDVVGDLNGGERLVTAIDSNAPSSYWARKRSTLGATLTFTVPGVPMFFQGQEMLENRAFDSSLPVDWSKTNTYNYIVRFYRDLIRVRRNLDGYTPGLKDAECEIYQEDDVNKLLAYRRWANGATNRDVFVIANFANDTLTNYVLPFPATGTWYTHLNTDSTNYGPDYGNVGSSQVVASGSPAMGAITIAPYSALILSRTPGVPPPVNIAMTTGAASLSWPNTYSGWVLDTTTTLAGNPPPWTQVASSLYQTNSATTFVNIPLTTNASFYRLRNP